MRPLPVCPKPTTRPFVICKGAQAVVDGRAVRVLAVCAANRIQVRVEGTNEIIWTSAGQLSAFREEAAASQDVRLPMIADPAQETKAARWAEALAELPSTGFATKAERQEIAIRMGVSVRTVDRRFAAFQADPTPASQLDGVPGPNVGTKYLAPAVEKIIDLAYGEVYLVLEHPSVAALEVRIRGDCRAAGLVSPDYNTIRARVREKDPLYAARKRLGREEGDARQAPAIGGLKVTESLAAVQVDHALVDLLVVSPVSRQVIGRPWISLAIDVATRCVLGFYLSFDPPSQTSVGLCLEHACFPKDVWLASLGIDVDYPMFGRIRCVHWDNAKCFKATGVPVQCERYGTRVNARPVRKPRWGAYIERYIGTFMGAIHVLPGTTFSNVKQKGSYESERHAIFSYSELLRWAALEIAGVYHNTPHDGLGGLTPAEKWAQAWTQKDGSICLPPLMPDRRAFLLGFLPFKCRAVSREGIELFGMHYWDPGLTPYINDGDRRPVHYDQRDLSVVHLYAGKAYLDIPLVDRSQPGFSIYELRDAKRALALEHDVDRSEAKLFAAIRQQRNIQDEAASKSAAARRAQARRPVEEARSSDSTSVDYSEPVAAPDPAWGQVP